MVGKIHWSITCFLSEMGSCLSWSISLFFPKQLHAALILAYISSLVVSLRLFYKKGYSTTDHLQALNQIIEKSNEYNLPLCIGFIDYEKAFDTVEHFAIFEALRKTNVNEIYINILQNIYNQATARVHLDKLVSTEFQIHRGVRQGDPLSPKLFTAVMEEVFKKAEISEGVNVDGENLSNLRFADDVALLNETSKQMEKHMNNLNSESMKVGLKIHKGKTKYMTNYADSEDILIGQQKIEKVTEFKYLAQTTHLKVTD